MLSNFKETTMNTKTTLMSLNPRNRALRCAVALSLLAPLALLAQEIQIKDLESGTIIDTVEPGGTVILAEGAQIRLIMSVQAKGRTYYPYTKYWKAQRSAGAVRITHASIENANVTLLAIGGAGSSERINYEITEDVRGELEGFVTIRIQEEEEEEDAAPSGHHNTGWAGEITDTLYHGILMRDMDASGGRSYSERIRNGNYATVVQIAQEIARSQESRVDMYEQRRITNRQRLDALYEHLLQLGSDDIDEQEWADNLERLNAGRIGDVVSDMVRSQRFRQVHDM
jgi:hypothetical protein